MTIPQEESPVALEPGQEYLLFLRLEREPDGSPYRLGMLAFGDATVFKVNRIDDSISRISERDNNPFSSSLLARVSRKYSSLVSAIAVEKTGKK